MRALLVLVTLGHAAAADVPTTKTAAGRCASGPVNVIAKLPADESYRMNLAFGMVNKRGIAIYKDGDHGLKLVRLAASGAVQGKPVAFTDWPARGVELLVPTADGWIAITKSGCTGAVYDCFATRFVGADGTLGPVAQPDIGSRRLYFEGWTSGTSVVVRLDRSGAKSDALMTIDRGDHAAPTVAVHELDWGGHDSGDTERVFAGHDADGTLWLLHARYAHDKVHTSTWRVLDRDGKATPMTGWDPAWEIITTGPNRSVLAFADSHHKELVELAMENATFIEKRRTKYDDKTFPAGFDRAIRGDEGTNQGIALERDGWGGELPKTLLSDHLAPVPGTVAWDSGAFYATYAERNKSNVVLKLRRVTCR